MSLGDLRLIRSPGEGELSVLLPLGPPSNFSTMNLMVAVIAFFYGIVLMLATVGMIGVTLLGVALFQPELLPMLVEAWPTYLYGSLVASLIFGVVSAVRAVKWGEAGPPRSS